MERKRVLVGMSGGVDSAAAAALLQDSGYEAAGCTLRLLDSQVLGQEVESGCCSLETFLCSISRTPSAAM